MALIYLEDYLTGQPGLVTPKLVSNTAYQWLLNYLTGQLSLVLVQGSSTATGGGWGLLLALKELD
jgi:hypothetical protein